jgi:hypothetical protein
MAWASAASSTVSGAVTGAFQPPGNWVSRKPVVRGSALKARWRRISRRKARLVTGPLSVNCASAAASRRCASSRSAPPAITLASNES